LHGSGAVKYQSDDPAKGAIVTIENLEKMAMPVILQYETVTHKTGTVTLPVEVWNNTAVWNAKLPTTEELISVTIDPDKLLPDVNFLNNIWKKK